MVTPKKIKFDEKKFRQAILYLLSLSPNKTIEGKKKLAKLLYFADFNFFEAYEQYLTGASYRALKMGPVPDQLEKFIKTNDSEVIKISSKKTGLENDTVVFSLNKNQEDMILDKLTENERKVLQKVFRDYGNLSGGDLEKITHSEAPYNAVAQGEYIPYELSFYREKSMEELVGV